MKINLKLDIKQKKKNGHPFILSIYVSKSDRMYKYTGFFSEIEQWDFKREEPKRSHPHFLGIMDFILEIKRKTNELINQNKRLTAEQIHNFLFGKSEDFYYFWEKRIEEFGNEGNKEIHENSLNEFRKFRKNLSFDEIDYNFLNGFKLWKKKTCTNNTLNTYLSKIRAVYNEGIRRGVFTPQFYISPFEKIMEASEKTKDKYLTIDEMRMITKNPNKTKFDHYFLLCFFLGGVDFIDIASLKHSHISQNRVKFERFKGKTKEVIDNCIFPEAWEIINSFADEEFLTDIHNYSLKTHRDNYIKRYRNQLQDLGITSYVSSKSARYTFINIGKELLLNRDVIMELTGHARNDVHSIYEGKFSNNIKDEVHRKIIDAVLG